MKRFWFIITDLDDETAKNIWMRYQYIHCTVFPDKTYIYGDADDSTIYDIADILAKLNKEYSLDINS